jgi:hypothetical protein
VEKPVEEISVGFHVNKDGQLLISFEIPAAKTTDELYTTVRDTSILLNAITSGLLNEEIAKVLANNLDAQIVAAIIENWGLYKQLTDEAKRAQDDEPVVRPSDVFKESGA